MTVTIIHETDTLVLGQERDEIRALGIMVSLGALTANYGGSKLFTFVENVQIPIGLKQYGILYERADREASLMVPVAFITWAYLGRSAEVIFSEFLRPLNRDEWKSGKTLWLMDMIAPLGHVTELVAAFDVTVGVGHEEYHRMKIKNGRMERGVRPNRNWDRSEPVVAKPPVHASETVEAQKAKLDAQREARKPDRPAYRRITQE